MASSFWRSRAFTSSWMEVAPSSSSRFRSMSASRCSLKFTYWSSAFLFTWEYLVSAWFTLCNFFMSSLTEKDAWASSSAAGKEPSCWIFFRFSSRFWTSMERLFSCFSVSFSASARASWSAASAALSSSSFSSVALTRAVCSWTFSSSSWRRASTESASRDAWASSERRVASCSMRSWTSMPPASPPCSEESFSSMSSLLLSRLSLRRACRVCF
mmetsp:Transcript_24707/g.72479  ORF Transcript_24707/g.72479 Transcript_24707/m.72479 type:complete len:214 (+) Transcript_24707:822-1463(+)